MIWLSEIQAAAAADGGDDDDAGEREIRSEHCLPACLPQCVCVW